ncbi:response regulator transcription factor [Fulvivirgaceae bacterium PWU4]|uniref:Response regulator transcription factor n=1 Tax=Chryseosolibacter histidini TaxID=2782349 RepID=A0AAP2GP46_9BACT|nr:response regulator transcription factor [Chryseosolibacter histidini]MBT1697540.1 response regulator transcription factor [Chryseosolibacter histidini]
MKFLIADDHAIVRKGLVDILREEFPASEVTEVASSSDAIQEAGRHAWDAILLDISMPGRNGIETLKQIRANGVNAPILMLSMHPEDQYAVRVLKAGASGFLNKESATDELLHAIHRVLSGKKYITPFVAEKLAEADGDKPAHELLSDREMQVLQLIASGKTVSEVATEISLSVNTISTYRARILDKLGLNNNAELTRYAIDNHLV